MFELKKESLISFKTMQSDGEVVLTYKNPSTSQRVDYSRELIDKTTGKIVDNAEEIRVQKGKELCTGFIEGSFTVDDIKISSDPNSENYFPEWKGMIEETVSYFFSMIALTAYEGWSVDTKRPLALSSGNGKTHAPGRGKKSA
jgi:hypothetical protein